ncbi:MAG: SPASM domain-containing protein, partial [bacterium]|nr:SPASM domain-containing protein [bacterium]
IFDILSYARQKGLMVSVVSNGSLLDEERVKKIKDTLDLRFDKIQVSLDGSNAKVHEKQRGVRGIFKKTIRGIELLTKYGIPYTICSVATLINLADIPAIIQLAEEKGAGIYRLMHLHPFGKAVEPHIYKKYGLSFAQECALLEFIERKREEHNDNSERMHISEENGFVFQFNHRTLRRKRKKDKKLKPATLTCTAGTSSFSIGPEGNVAACSFFQPYPELFMGNVKRQSIEDIWNDEESFAKFRNVTESQGKCRTCDYLNDCRGGCFAMAYALKKKIGAPDPFCNMYEDNAILC